MVPQNDGQTLEILPTHVIPIGVTCGTCMSSQKDESGEALVMPEDKVNIQLLNVAGAEINNAMTNPFFGKL